MFIARLVESCRSTTSTGIAGAGATKAIDDGDEKTATAGCASHLHSGSTVYASGSCRRWAGDAAAPANRATCGHLKMALRVENGRAPGAATRARPGKLRRRPQGAAAVRERRQRAAQSLHVGEVPPVRARESPVRWPAGGSPRIRVFAEPRNTPSWPLGKDRATLAFGKSRR